MYVIKTTSNTFIRPHMFMQTIERITESRTPYDIEKLSGPREVKPQEVYKWVMDWLDSTVEIRTKQKQEEEVKVKRFETTIRNTTAKLEELYLQPYGEVVDEVQKRERQVSNAKSNQEYAQSNVNGYTKSIARLENVSKRQPKLVKINLK